MSAWGAFFLAAQSVLIPGIPHVAQKPDFCGEACAEMYLRKLGHPIDQDEVFALAGVDPALGRGAFTAELKRALERLGFHPGDVWHEVRAGDPLEGEWRGLYDDLQKKIPSIVCMHYDEEGSEHFRLVVGYDGARDEVIYHEPAAKKGAYQRMGRKRFLALWPLKYKSDRWSVIRLRMEAGAIAKPAPPKGHSAADYAQHIMELKKKVPAGFTLFVERPFVVV